jgi:hypothetical protein
MKKFVYLLILLSFFSYAKAGDNKTVSLITSGQGKTKDAAKYNALRNALEKAFGAFISSNTTLLNDELIKDEIVSVSSGNIQNFEILSETQMPDGSYSSVLKATVSIGKLYDYCISKNMKNISEIKIDLNSVKANIELAKYESDDELKAIENLIIQLDFLEKKSFDYNIETTNPSLLSDGTWVIHVNINAEFNENVNIIQNMLLDFLEKIKLSNSELDLYFELSIPKKYIYLENTSFALRNYQSVEKIKNFIDNIIKMKQVASNFIVKNEITNYSYNEFKTCDYSNRVTFKETSSEFDIITFMGVKMGFSCCMSNYYTNEQLEKISKYEVLPINK